MTNSVVQLESLPQQQKSEQFEKLKKLKQMLECWMTSLQVPKNNISPNFKEKLVHVERQIVTFISMHGRKPGVTLQQPLTAPHINSLHQSQQTQGRPHENQMNSQIQSVNLQQNTVGLLQPNSNMIQRQQLKQLQNREMQQQILHKQILHHQQQFHPQTKQQQQQQQNGNPINNELKIRQQIEMKSQQLKSGASPQIDQQSLLNSVTKSGTPLQSANSPFIGSSPSTPSMSHMPIDSEKVNSGVSSLSYAAGHQPTAAMLHPLSLATGTSGISPSPLLAEFTSPHGESASVVVSGKSSTIEEAMEHLLKVVSNHF